MFGNGNTPKAGVVDYATALQRYETAERWRGCDERILTTRRCKTQSVRLGRDDRVIFRLHRTDCVVYYPDGRLELNLYASALTTSFIRALTDGSMDVDLTSSVEHFVVYTGAPNEYRWYGVDDKTGHFVRSCVVLHRGTSGGWELAPDTVKRSVELPSINRKVAKAALAQYRYAEFVPFATALVSMGGLDAIGARPSVYNPAWPGMDDDDVLICLESNDGWPDLMRAFGPNAPAAVRKAIYKGVDGLLTHETITEFTGGYKALRAIAGRIRAYQIYA